MLYSGMLPLERSSTRQNVPPFKPLAIPMGRHARARSTSDEDGAYGLWHILMVAWFGTGDPFLLDGPRGPNFDLDNYLCL